MNHDDETRTVLLDILRIGILRIRLLGWDGHGQQCAIEADHLHNIPQLIQSLNLEQLLYYYSIERPAFLSSIASNTNQFKSYWEHLAQLIHKKPDSGENPRLSAT